MIPFNNVSFNKGGESMDTAGEYFINNDIGRIIKYLCYAEPDVSFGDFVTLWINTSVPALVAC